VGSGERLDRRVSSLVIVTVRAAGDFDPVPGDTPSCGEAR
jgi:hypothetical protein